MNVSFCDSVDDALLEYVVIIAKYNGRWVYCKHRERNTFEIAGGHREAGEKIFETAKRELFEETGALEYDLKPVCVYCVTQEQEGEQPEKVSYGMLYYAKVKKLSIELNYEIERVYLLDKMPPAERLTYPQIQPLLVEEFERRTKHGEKK